MSRPFRLADQVTRRDLKAGLVGAVLSAVLVLYVATVIGGPTESGADAAPPPVVPDVPPPPDTGPAPEQPDPVTSSAAEPATGGPDEKGDETEHDEEPSEAPLVADAPPAGTGPLPDLDPVACPAATWRVDSAGELVEALTEAAPGDVVEMAPGTYEGNFATTASGTVEEPIFWCGPEDAVLDGGDVEDGYVVHLDGAQHWRLVGFTVTRGQKGVMADGTVGSVFQGLTVTGIGDEAIHLRSHSTDNLVRDNVVSDTGNRNEKYGEGVYLGSAVSNWCTYTECEADRSDRNAVVANTFTDLTSEAVDVKEGTTGGVVIGNTFDGAGQTGADSWVDVKGNNYLVADNVGTTAPEDGFQTHEILPGWGDLNVFRGNVAQVDGPGSGISSWPPGSNVVTCDNRASGAGEGLSNIPCT